MPLISIIIPSYNRKQMLFRAVNSVLKQTFTDYELIVVDDGSIDGTEGLEVWSTHDIQYIRLAENGGVSRARNKGVGHSCGEWIAFLDSDDEWMAHKLENQVEWTKRNREYRILQTKEIWIRNGKRVNPPLTHEKFGGDLFSESLQRCMITPSSVMLRRDLFDEVGMFDESLPACEDYDLWLRITCKYPVGLVNEYLLYRYGGHSDQLSSSIMGLDRFRIRSLLSIIQNSDLDDEQKEMVSKNLVKRSEIVAKGYLKRGNKLLYERYIEIAGKYRG